MKKCSISKTLDKRLSPEYISYRRAWGETEVAYIEGWSAIAIANKIFGYNGWSSTIKEIKIDFIEEVNKKFIISVSCIVTITLKDGTQREDVGCGSSESKNKIIGIEKAKKEAATDAIKRTLRQFGNALGNCCYDKEYLAFIKKNRKQTKPKFNSNDLLDRNFIYENQDSSEIDILASFNSEAYKDK
ncbi:RAD52 protein [Spraguea lophii 42_110]|uniref:RAD52 protein n=1 Tax=Spraguea lophii (strain 42_110) TaxID=1358809 RepID=S7WAR1_SPRLO|nr:RAD52 protein [Spraguea lophii 42_110]